MARAGLDTAAVVAAAAVLADADGLDGLTLSRLAERVGVRTPSLYSHVGGLDDLRRLVALRTIEGLTAALSSAAVGRAGDDAVRALAAAYRDYARAHPGAYEAIVRAPDPSDEQFAAAAHASADVVIAVLRGYGLEGDQAVHATRALRSALHGFVSLEASGGFGLPVDIDASFDHLVGVLTAGMRGG